MLLYFPQDCVCPSGRSGVLFFFSSPEHSISFFHIAAVGGISEYGMNMNPGSKVWADVAQIPAGWVY